MMFVNKLENPAFVTLLGVGTTTCALLLYFPWEQTITECLQDYATTVPYIQKHMHIFRIKTRNS